MSRRAPRYRIDIAAAAVPLLGGDMAVCRTRDVSEVGVCLDTAAWFPIGTRLSLALVDPANGTALEVIGDVVREAQAPRWVLGILLIEPPFEWRALVKAAARRSENRSSPIRRSDCACCGSATTAAGRMALYVTSGWDVLFGSDQDSIAEAIENIDLDAVVAELDISDPRLPPIMAVVRRSQPTARRIVRGDGKGEHELVHRFVDRDAGLEALLDAVTADIPLT